jgi:hypothetical protein
MHTKDEFEAYFGPPARYSDHTAGQTITYCVDEEIHSGAILYVCAPAMTETGNWLPTCYVVERAGTDTAWLDFVTPAEIITSNSLY